MKKLVVLAAFMGFICLNSFAQSRKLRPDEISYFNNLHDVLYSSVPHTYKDWKVVGDSKEFDVFKYFCPIVYADDDCTGKCNTTLGVKESYQLNYSIDYTISDDESAGLMGTAYKTITDFTNVTQVAAALKSTAKTKLQIRIFANIMTGVFNFSTCPKTPAQVITLPVPATLAILGTRSDQCPIITDGRPELSPGDRYYDDAVVFLGKPVITKTTTTNHDDGVLHTEYNIGFDKTKIGVPKVQNVVVTFLGDQEDIKAAIKLMDWQKLYSLIGK